MIFLVTDTGKPLNDITRYSYVEAPNLRTAATSVSNALDESKHLDLTYRNEFTMEVHHRLTYALWVVRELPRFVP